MPDYWSRYHSALAASLRDTQVTSTDGRTLTPEAGLEQLCVLTESVRAGGGTIHFVGNGASACMASHMALDWSKNGGVPATAYNDIASLTAVGNDLGYDQVFAAPLRWHARKGDLLATISSSGNSPNVLRAIAAAREKELHVVTFSGLKPENKSRALGDLNIYVQAWSYGIVECAHQTLLHAWLDRFMNVREWEMTRPQFT